MSASGHEPVPAALRAALRRDFAPVSPLARPARRALVLALPALAGLAAAALLLVRGQGFAVLSLAGGGVSLLEWLTGLGLLWLALREAVPGLGVGAGRALAALAGGLLLQLLLGIFVWQSSGAGPSGPAAQAIGLHCASFEGAIGLPHLAIALWLVMRALPLRPLWSGALAGAAAGLLADSLWHLACPRYDREHLLVWHFGATVAMTLAGAALGLWGRPAGPAKGL